MEPKYKVGDRVRVIQRTEAENRYRGGFVDKMAAKAGKIYTIASSLYIGADENKLPDDGYAYSLKEISFKWASSMLEPAPEEPEVLELYTSKNSEPEIEKPKSMETEHPSIADIDFSPKKKHYQLNFTV